MDNTTRVPWHESTRSSFIFRDRWRETCGISVSFRVSAHSRYFLFGKSTKTTRECVGVWVYPLHEKKEKKKEKEIFFRFLSFPAVAPLNIFFFLSRENSSRNEMKIKRKQMCHFVTLAIRAE